MKTSLIPFSLAALASQVNAQAYQLIGSEGIGGCDAIFPLESFWITSPGDEAGTYTECAYLYAPDSDGKIPPEHGFTALTWYPNPHQNCPPGSDGSCEIYVTQLQFYADENCTEAVGDSHKEWWCGEGFDAYAPYWKLNPLD